MTISSRASDVRRRRPLGTVGSRLIGLTDLIADAVNTASQASQIDTITVDTASNTTAYTVTIDGVSVSYTSDASATKPEIIAGLVAAVNAEPLIRGYVIPTHDGIDKVYLTGSDPAVTFTTAESDSNLSLATSSAVEASEIPFGRAVIGLGFANDGDGNLGASQKCGLPLASLMTAQVATIAVVYAASEVYLISVTFEGQTYHFQIAADTDTNTTATAIRTAINNRMPASTILAGGSAGSITLTAESAGLGFEVGVGTNTGTAARITLSATTDGYLTDIDEAFLGIAYRAYDEEVNASGIGVYPANAGVKLLRRGLIVVETAESVAFGDPVYVETASGSSTGKLYKTTSSTRRRISSARWIRLSSTSTDGVAVVELL